MTLTTQVKTQKSGSKVSISPYRKQMKLENPSSDLPEAESSLAPPSVGVAPDPQGKVNKQKGEGLKLAGKGLSLAGRGKKKMPPNPSMIQNVS